MSEGSELWRAPAHSNGHWQREDRVSIGHEPWLGKGEDGLSRAGVTLSGTLASGRGRSHVVMQISPDDYAAVVRAMFHEDREAALKAFAQTILKNSL